MKNKEYDGILKEFKQLAVNGYLVDINKLSDYKYSFNKITRRIFGKASIFKRPVEALKHPIIHIHVMPLGYQKEKHQKSVTSDLSIIYADLMFSSYRVIYILDVCSSHNDNIPVQKVKYYIDTYENDYAKLHAAFNLKLNELNKKD
ncbi:hypothetical protein F164LOC_18830 [Pectobacterium carotovorum]|nr:hypothetical protein F164LOC_18830 [Pectobacterium carotovorum]